MNAVLKIDTHTELNYDHVPHKFDSVPAFMQLKDEFIKANNCVKMLGSGSYGQVWELPDNENVLKVCSTSDLAKDGYHSFLKIIIAMKGNPFVPRVEKFVKFSAGKDWYENPVTVYGLKMERLYPLYDTPVPILDRMGKELFRDFTQDDYYETLRPSYSFIRCLRKAISLNPIHSLNPDLLQLADAIADVRKKGNHCDDIGESNIMMRHTLDWDNLNVHYQLVITDPIA